MHGRDEKCITILVRKSEGKGPLGGPWHTRKDIKKS
jgi:hypothetical protein